MVIGLDRPLPENYLNGLSKSTKIWRVGAQRYGGQKHKGPHCQAVQWIMSGAFPMMLLPYHLSAMRHCLHAMLLPSLHSRQLGPVWAPATSRCTQVSTQTLSVFLPDMLSWSTWPVNCITGMGIFSLSTFYSLYFTLPSRGMEAIVGIKSAFFSAVLPVKNDLAFSY